MPSPVRLLLECRARRDLTDCSLVLRAITLLVLMTAMADNQLASLHRGRRLWLETEAQEVLALYA